MLFTHLHDCLRTNHYNFGNRRTLCVDLRITKVQRLLLFPLQISFLFYRQYIHRSLSRMNFDNPVYRKTTEDQFSLEKSQLQPGRIFPPALIDEVSNVKSYFAQITFRKCSYYFLWDSKSVQTIKVPESRLLHVSLHSHRAKSMRLFNFRFRDCETREGEWISVQELIFRYFLPHKLLFCVISRISWSIFGLI